MNNKTEIRYRLTWTSNDQRTRKEAYFVYREMAETWYDEKLAAGKKPQLWKEETTTTFEAMHPTTPRRTTMTDQHPITQRPFGVFFFMQKAIYVDGGELSLIKQNSETDSHARHQSSH